MDVDGSNVTRLTDPAWDDWSPVWSPDGGQMVFNSSRGDNREIWVMRADGTGKTNITQDAADDWWPDWSPDGSRIVFHSDRDGGFDIYSMSPDGKDVRRLTEFPGLAYDGSWSPDGSRIAFTADTRGTRQVCMIDADGGGLTAISRSTANDWAPAWRPDESTAALRPAARSTATYPATARPAGTSMRLPTPVQLTQRPTTDATATLSLAMPSATARATFGFPTRPLTASATPRPPTATATLRPPTATRVVGTLPSSGNLALHQFVSASRSEAARPARRLVDGIPGSDWGSGAPPPQWIEVDLGAPAQITQIRLEVTQYPNGRTVHRILVGAAPGELSEVHRFDRQTRSGDWLIFAPEAPLQNVQFVRIQTDVSPSWVGWIELEVIGER
jgi:hypothetical protein